jgi:predicted MFS family arabinose efflux permease
MSIFLVGSFIGTITVSLLSPALTGAFGWRMTFALYASLGLATACAFWRLGAENPRPPRAQRIRLRAAMGIFRSPLVCVCNALQFIRFAAATAFNFWVPSLLLSDRGLPLTRVGLLIAFSAACAAAANPLGGYLSDRLGNPPLVIGGSLAVLACTSVWIVAADSTVVLMLAVGLNSIFMTIYFGPLFAVPIEALGKPTAGFATGVGNLFANLGALAAAYTLGWLKDATGSFAAGFHSIAALCAFGVLLSVLLARLRRRALRARAGAPEWMHGTA